MDENGEILLLHASKNNACPLVLPCALYTLSCRAPRSIGSILLVEQGDQIALSELVKKSTKL